MPIGMGAVKLELSIIAHLQHIPKACQTSQMYLPDREAEISSFRYTIIPRHYVNRTGYILAAGIQDAVSMTMWYSISEIPNLP